MTGSPRYASMTRRVVAALIDIPACVAFTMASVLPVALALGLVFVASGVSQGTITTTMTLLGYAWGVAGPWLYFALMESSRKQATLGKLAAGIYVASLRPGPVRFKQAMQRVVAKWLGIIPAGIGLLRAFMVPNRQAFHDSFAGTVVLRRGHHGGVDQGGGVDERRPG